jgi:hypothetical protein
MIFLDVSPEAARRRRDIVAAPSWWHSAGERLKTARREADLYLDTDDLTPAQVLELALQFLGSAGQEAPLVP